MKKLLALSAVILFTVIPAGAGANEPADHNVAGSRQAANASPRQEIKSDAREAKNGIKATAKQVRYDIKHFFKNGWYEVKHAVKEAFR